MTPERWQQVKSLFNRALECEPPARAAFIEEHSGGDTDLRREVATLIARHEETHVPETKPMGQLASHLLREETAVAMVGQHVGPYRLIREIGWGGMGTVFEAARADDEFRKTVAVKIVRREMASQVVVQRFRHERQILAGLDHPNVAGLMDGGVTGDGRPWFAMEYVEGRPIDEYCRSRSLPVRERIALFLEVCDAVQYAHRSLVVHRDLKPTNILVSESGQPKLLDFGIAKLLGDGAGAANQLTRAGDLFLTPDYASPEQVRGSQITTASDVYSLGIILYELLARRRPWRLDGRPLQEIVHTITEMEPVRPSAAVAAEDDASSPDGNPMRLRRLLAGDLDSIVLKAIRKEPEQRYSSVEQLKEDLLRYLDGRPVLARENTNFYRMRKFVRRHTAAVATVMLLIVTLAGGIVATMSQARRAEAERARAQARFDDLRGLTNSVIFEIHDSIAELSGATATRALLVQRGMEYLDRLSRQSNGDASLEKEVASAYIRLGEVQGQPTAANLGDLQAARESYLRALAIAQRLLAANPSDRDVRRSLALAREKLSDVESHSGNPRAGVTHARAALEVWESLSGGETSSARAMRPLAVSYIKLGDVLGNPSFPNVGDPAGAMAAYQRSLSILKALPSGGEEDRAVRRYIALAHERIGDVYGIQRRYDEAAAAFEESFIVRRALASENPSNRNALRDEGVAHEKICSILVLRGDTRAAIPRCQQAVQIYERLHTADPRDAQSLETLAIGHRWMYRALEARGDLRAALAEVEESTRLFEKLLQTAGHGVPAVRGAARNILHASMLNARLSVQSGVPAAERASRRNKAIAGYERAREMMKALRAQNAGEAADEKLLREASAAIGVPPGI